MFPEACTRYRNCIQYVTGRLPWIDERQMNTFHCELLPHIVESVDHLEPAFAAASDSRHNKPPASGDFLQAYQATIG